jgi:hypothetical protein
VQAGDQRSLRMRKTGTAIAPVPIKSARNNVMMPDYPLWREPHWTLADGGGFADGGDRRKPPYRCKSGKKSMAIRLQTLGWTVWIMVLVVLLLVLLAGIYLTGAV